MTSEDFIYLNVPGLLNRIDPSGRWQLVVLAWTRTEIDFFLREGLLKPTAPGLIVPLDQAVFMFSDYTAEGQAFLKSGAVHEWLSACDRKKDVNGYSDATGLRRRLLKFRASARPQT